jgi:hypothetical protein
VRDDLSPLVVSSGVLAIFVLDPYVGAAMGAPIIAAAGWRIGASIAGRRAVQASPRDGAQLPEGDTLSAAPSSSLPSP